MNDKIDEVLGIRPLSEIEEKKETLPIQKQEHLPAAPKIRTKEAAENIADIELAKRNIENIIGLGDDAVKEMVSIAKQSESPRAFEVVSTLMKTLLDANKDYVELSTKKRFAKEEEETKQETNITNNNLIVSTADLLKMLKGEGSE